MRGRLELDVGAFPELRAFVEAAQASGQRAVLRDGNTDVALIVPIVRDEHQGTVRRNQVLDAIAGAAGTLPHPLSLDEIRAIVDQDRVEAYRAKHA